MSKGCKMFHTSQTLYHESEYDKMTYGHIQQVGLLTYRSHILPSQYKAQWHKELDVQLRITAAGLCKNLTCFPSLGLLPIAVQR